MSVGSRNVEGWGRAGLSPSRRLPVSKRDPKGESIVGAQPCSGRPGAGRRGPLRPPDGRFPTDRCRIWRREAPRSGEGLTLLQRPGGRGRFPSDPRQVDRAGERRGNVARGSANLPAEPPGVAASRRQPPLVRPPEEQGGTLPREDRSVPRTLRLAAAWSLPNGLPACRPVTGAGGDAPGDGSSPPSVLPSCAFQLGNCSLFRHPDEGTLRQHAAAPRQRGDPGEGLALPRFSCSPAPAASAADRGSSLSGRGRAAASREPGAGLALPRPISPLLPPPPDKGRYLIDSGNRARWPSSLGRPSPPTPPLPRRPDRGRYPSGSGRAAAIRGSGGGLDPPLSLHLPLSRGGLTGEGIRREAAASRPSGGSGEGLALPLRLFLPLSRRRGRGGWG